MQRAFSRRQKEQAAKELRKASAKRKVHDVRPDTRKLRRLDEQYDRWTDYYHRKMAELYGKLVEADRAAGRIE